MEPRKGKKIKELPHVTDDFWNLPQDLAIDEVMLPAREKIKELPHVTDDFRNLPRDLAIDEVMRYYVGVSKTKSK